MKKENEGLTSNIDVLPPESPPSAGGDIPDILAFISNYTDRPDLLIAELEKHDPGFIRSMNESARQHSEKLREGRFNFGKRQAYTSLIIQVIAALTLLGLFGFLIVSGGANFWIIIALVIFYAVTQGGSRGFHKIIESVSKLLAVFSGRGKPEKE